MDRSKNTGFADRLSAAADAKKAQLERAARARSAAESPAAVERRTARKAVTLARDARVAEEGRRLGALAGSLLDGLAVWGRELVRPEEEQSPTIIRHEAERARRLTDLWETEIDHPVMLGGLNMVQIRLGCALGLEVRNPQLHWRPQHPKLSAWYDRIAERPSFGATAPPR